MRAVVLLTVFVGCGQAEVLPLLDASGDLAGSFDPSSGELLVAADVSVIENQEGEQVAVSGGLAGVDWTLIPGDELLLLDSSGEAFEALHVESPEFVDGLSDEEAESRYAGCIIL
jgi:hypothetical protein